MEGGAEAGCVGAGERRGGGSGGTKSHSLARMSGVRAAKQAATPSTFPSFRFFFFSRSGRTGLGLWRMSTPTPAALPGRSWLVTSQMETFNHRNCLFTTSVLGSPK